MSDVALIILFSDSVYNLCLATCDALLYACLNLRSRDVNIYENAKLQSDPIMF